MCVYCWTQGDKRHHSRMDVIQSQSRMVCIIVTIIMIIITIQHVVLRNAKTFPTCYIGRATCIIE